MNRRFEQGEALAWYKALPWITGCNYVCSATLHNIEMFQGDTFDEVYAVAEKEIALMESMGMNSVRMFLPFWAWYHDRERFLDRVDFYLSALHMHGITMMPVLFNDCVGFGGRPGTIVPAPGKGFVRYDIGHHGGFKANPFTGERERVGWILWDEPQWQDILLEYLSALLTRFGGDSRVIIWDLWNEPGNSNREDRSIPYLKAVFAKARELNPSQPLTAGCWRYDLHGKELLRPIERLAVEESDVITFHQYESFDRVKAVVAALKGYGRPMLNTEWLNRVLNNFYADNLTLYHDEGIGSYSWGLVAGKSQHFLPWDELRRKEGLDLTRWQHDLFDPWHTAYDPEEIALHKRLTGKA